MCNEEKVANKLPMRVNLIGLFNIYDVLYLEF